MLMSATCAARRSDTRRWLLSGVSGSAITLAAAQAVAAGAPPLSPAWFAARVDASTSAAAASGSAAGTLAQVTAAQRNLATLATRLQQMQAVQRAAAAAAATAQSKVPDGLVLGGLQPAAGAVAGSALWSGAALPTQASTATGVAVAVKQTSAQAALTWQTFNVGRHTALTFDQSAGGAAAGSWVVLNRVQDPNAAPSQVLGSITAPGKVYIVNPNGILFGAGAQVDLGSLIASTADISAAQFASGIYGAVSGSSFLPSFTGAAASSAVTVEQGASITTTAPTSVTSGGGYVMLLGGTVENDGQITTPNGQTVLAAGEDFILRQGYSTAGNQTATVQGSQIATDGTGSATNAGLVQADLGDITLAGHAVTQAGIALSTTSVNTRGSIHLLNATTDKTGSVTLAPGSVTSVDPDNAATTALDSQRSSLIAQSATNNALRATPAGAGNPQLDDVGSLADRLDLSRVEITTGGVAAFDDGSLTLSQGGQIAVQAGQQAWVGSGAQLDVSGSTGAVRPASSNTLSVTIEGNELRDAPVNRDTGLITNATVSIDERQLVQVAAGTGGDANLRDYTAGGLLEVSGYVGNQGHTIDEWDAVGGTIMLATQPSGSVVTQPGSTLNIAGGAVAVQGGQVAQSYLIGTDGDLYNVNTAPAGVQYAGVYGGFTVTDPRFGVTNTYAGTLAAPTSIEQAGYSYGRDAGSVVVSAQSAALEGTIAAGVTDGSQQTAARAAGVSDGYQFSQSAIAQPGTLAVGGFTSSGALLDPYVTIGDGLTPVAAATAPGAAPTGFINMIRLSASQLDSEALGGLSVTTGKAITVDAPITLAPGGTLTLLGGLVDVAASVTARGGRVTIADVTTNPVTGSVVAPAAGQQGGVTIENGSTIDLRGTYLNTVGDATNHAGAGLANGGTLSVDSARMLDVAAGTTIDASSGAALLAGGKQVGGTGGSVTLIGDDPFYGVATNAVVIAPTLRDAGVNGGGTLSLTAPSVLIGAGTPSFNTVQLAADIFLSGFSRYVVNGFDRLDVAPQTVLSVAMPVYAFYGDTEPTQAPTGADPSAALQLLLPPTYSQNAARGRLTQRQGASLDLLSNDRPDQADFGGGTITLGAGSAITVDPGQSVRVEAYGQITDDARIVAPGGSVAIVNEQRETLSPAKTVADALSLSIWIGGDAVIDVAGEAVTALDRYGRSYGTLTAGGSIDIGGDGGVDAVDNQIATDAQVLIRPGALLDASGASATIDLLAGTTPQLGTLDAAGSSDPVAEATQGGTIALSSYSGIGLDGIVRAPGGDGAAGGTLAMTLESPVYPQGSLVPNPLRAPREITISEATEADPLAAANLLPGGFIPAVSFGTASISQQQIDAGGFANLSLYARDAFVFDGTVDLHAADSIVLSQGILADASSTAAVSVSAPYVRLSGQTQLGDIGDAVFLSINAQSWHPYARATTATLTVAAGLIDLANNLRFGVSDSLPLAAGSAAASMPVNLPGFADLVLSSTGDIRFGTGSLTTPGDLELDAAQVYPVTGAKATVYAGYNEYGPARNLFVPTGTITINRVDATPSVPYSIGGSLSLIAGSIVQDGVLRAPEGTLALGGVAVGPSGLLSGQNPAQSFTYGVTLLPGSITSVSLDGATVPYGGTVDGVTYFYNGTAVAASGFAPSITLASQTQDVQDGAVLDLSGGGTLAGAGFITGRGGSTNVLTTPLLSFDAVSDSVSAPSLAAAPVYAILSGYASDYAPTSPIEAAGNDGSVPAIGAQITIGDGVPGIAAGTYTLLPSYYALLPGAARVQIDTGHVASVPGVTALGAGSYQLDVTTSVANTTSFTTPVQAIVTTGAGVLANSQFDQETYSAFELAQAAKYGTPRVALPEDGKTLDLVYPAKAASVEAFDFAGTALFGAVSGYYGGTASVGGINASALQLEVTADGATPTPGFTAIAASDLDALGADRLIIGGTLSRDQVMPGQLDFAGTADAVAIRAGATLTGPEVFLVAGASGSGSLAGSISVDPGATINTTTSGAPPYDSSSGYVYDANGYSTLAVSNGQLTFIPSTSSFLNFGAVTISDGASLLTDGTLTFVTDKALSLGTEANYGARYLSIDLDTINVVSDTAAAQAAAGTLILPSGLVLTQDVLSRLLQGDAALGVPALQSLILTANDSLNFAGSVALDTLDPATGVDTLQNFVLNTPAIYGYGGAGDTASITTGTLYWNGIESDTLNQGVVVRGSALPGGVVANGPGTGLGTLKIDASTIVLGYGPNTTPDDQVTLDRLIAGFATVDLSASESLSGNAMGALGVYQTAGATPGAAGSGGVLNITTPLLTGAAGSVDSIAAGGALNLVPGGVASSATSGALGAQIDLSGAGIVDDTTILLNSGRLQLAATGSVALGASARVDLAGSAVQLLDQTRYSGGGSLVVAADGGDVAVAPTATIDVAAVNAAAGSIQVTAEAGDVDLGGAIDGSASAGQASGGIDIRAGTLSDFDGLNARLDQGGVFGSRQFEIATGDLVVDTIVTAHDVTIATDSGSLNLTGVIDASGAAPGSITLAAGGDLTVADGAVLDAHGTVLQSDSSGDAIEAENRASVSLSTTGGTLTLGDAVIDVASADAVPLGQVTLTAPRGVVAGAETGDIAIDAAGPVDIIGAQSIAVYGSRTYTPTDANGTIEQHDDPAIAGMVSLDQIDADNTRFLTLAATQSGLQARLAGLDGYTGFHLRPADTIQSSAASNDNLTVNGDLDLSTLRYGAGATGNGAGEVGLLTLRAGNNLVVNGSITDGFATPPDAVTPTKDDKGWVLYANDPIGQNVTLPVDLAVPVQLAGGTIFSTANAVALNYPITIARANLRPDVVIPGAVVTAAAGTIPAGGFTATATITDATGAVIATAGQVLAAGTVIPVGAHLAAGTVLPFKVAVVTKTVWPAGALLSLFSDNSVRLVMKPHTTLNLAGGAFIPSGSSLVFANGANKVALRATNAGGTQGLVYALSALLPAGSQSWSINLVAGANLAGANLLAVQPAANLAAAVGTATDPGGSVVLNDVHYTDPSAFSATPSFSVVRTGTGALNVVAGGNVDEASLFGVYTAGTQTSLGAADAAFNVGRATLGNGTVLPGAYGTIAAGQDHAYPDHGGDVLVSAQNSVLGDIIGGGGAVSNLVGTDLVGDWLWKQGGAGLDQSTAWWINFGSYVQALGPNDSILGSQPTLAGFTGIGALGGGNVTVLAGGDAGEVGSFTLAANPISQGLVIAVADTGRVTDAGTMLTGGGALTLDVGGTLNPTAQGSLYGGLGGTLTDLRGDIDVQAGQVGRIDLDYGLANPTDPRPEDPFTTQFATSSNGITLVQGDSVASVDSMRDLVLAGTGDAGREPQQALTAIDPSLLPAKGHLAAAGDTGFTLWTDQTAVDLFSDGGNLTPTTASVDAVQGVVTNDAATDFRFVYPATLQAVAASGSLYYGAQGNTLNNFQAYSLELAPAPAGELSLLAANSIYAHGYTVDMSGASVAAGAIPTPDDPSYTDFEGNPTFTGVITNFLNSPAINPSPDALFGFEADTPTTDLHAGDNLPARIYAATGDLVDVQFGEAITYPLQSDVTPSTWYLAAKPAWIMAGRDIVSSGTRPQIYRSGLPAGTFATFPNEGAAAAADGVTAGDLLLNLNATDISVVSAGRDLLSSYLYVAGPGTLEVDAGRNIDDTGNNNLAFGLIKSLGPIIDTSAAARGTGAGIAVLTGTGGIGPDDTGFADLYFDAANQADLAIPLIDPANAGKVQQTYQGALLAFLAEDYGYAGSSADALAFFSTLPATAQDVFVRAVFFEELLQSGRQHSDATSLFYNSYARGRTAIATLFPSVDASGHAMTYAGDLTMDSGTLALAQNTTGTVPVFDAGISTLSGGSIQILSPGGADVFGVAGGPAPGSNSGVITYGSGDIDIYALNSVLLGQSRIFTTFGGNILIWSADGDINAGRGAKTTTVVPPPLIAYDAFGGVVLAPTAPTSGAGIATLAPIAGTTPGDVDLIAPLGTVDAGEAGIRVSGNLNIAAIFVANAANTSVGGKTTGSTAVATTNVAAATSAAATTGSTLNANTTAIARGGRQGVQQVSVITVEVIDTGNDDIHKRRRPAA